MVCGTIPKPTAEDKQNSWMRAGDQGKMNRQWGGGVRDEEEEGSS